jgi:hypothetical protein
MRCVIVCDLGTSKEAAWPELGCWATEKYCFPDVRLHYLFRFLHGSENISEMGGEVYILSSESES